MLGFADLGLGIQVLGSRFRASGVSGLGLLGFRV